MKKTIFISLLLFLSCWAVGFTPDPGYDFAEYKRLPKEKRIHRLQKAGEDLFLRRRYEDAINVFETILKLNEHDLTAKLWLSKSQYEIKREKDDAQKVALYKKYDGHLLPKDKIYINWEFGPEIGHFEVRYSEPKPRPVYKKKNRPKASEQQINDAIAKAKKRNASDTFELAVLYWSRHNKANALKYYNKACELDSEMLSFDYKKDYKYLPKASEQQINDAIAKAKKGNASDTFELAMLYWSRKDATNALKYYYKACELDPELLSYDDEDLISSVLNDLEGKIAKNKATASEYYEAGKINLLQSSLSDGIKYLLRAVKTDKNGYSKLVSSAIDQYLDTVPIVNFIETPEVNLFRQAYSYDKGNDFLYMHVNVTPRNNSQVFFVDLSFPYDLISSVKLMSNDVVQCISKPGIDDMARLWFLLPEKDKNEFSSYDIKCVFKLDRSKSDVLDLSNYAMSELFDNWSFVVANEVNFSSLGVGVNEFVEEGLRVSGYHLNLYEGRGPFVKFNDFTESIPSNMNIKDMFAFMVPREYELEEQETAVANLAPPKPSSSVAQMEADRQETAPQSSSADDKQTRPNVVYDIDNGTGKLSNLNNNKTNASPENKITPTLPAGDINDMDIGL